MENFIADWGYIALFLYSFGGGMLAIAIAGVFASTGELNIVYVIMIASFSNFIGDQFLFTLARKNKMYAKDIMKKHQRKIAYTHVIMKKYGTFVVFIQKYLYGVKTLVPLAMGISKYSMNKFIFYNAIASVVWGLIVGFTAYLLGNLFIEYLKQIKEYGFIFIILIVLLLIFLFKGK